MQDLLNILFHYFPEELYILPCSSNFRPDFCLSLDTSCPDVVNTESISILHGNRQVCQSDHGSYFLDYVPKMIEFFSKNIKNAIYAIRIRNLLEEQRTFRTVYKTFRLHQMTSKDDLLNHFKEELEQTEGMDKDLCQRIVPNIVQSFQSLMTQDKESV